MTDATSITVRTNSFAITKLPPMEYHQYASEFMLYGLVRMPCNASTVGLLNIEVRSNIFSDIYIAFIPEVKSPEKRLRLFHRFQTVVVPKLFKHRAVYDGNAIAYCPARLALPDSGSGIVSGSFQFFLYLFIVQLLVQYRPCFFGPDAR